MNKHSIKSLVQGSGIDTLGIFLRRKRWTRIRPAIVKYIGTEVSGWKYFTTAVGMSYAFIRYGFSFEEYFLFRIDEKSHAQRKAYITEICKEYFIGRVNTRQGVDLFNNKGMTYQRFAPYYHRDACMAHDLTRDYDTVKAFVLAHPTFIVKPNDASFGNGVKVVRDMSVEDIEVQLGCYHKGFIMEELIVQSPDMAVPHPASVNTLRISTLVVNGKTHIIQPFVRFGRGNGVVDNAGKGGVFGAIDIDTGVARNFKDEWGGSFTVHPDTQVQLEGFVIPRWQEALELAKHLSQVETGCAFVGWDLALTSDGWVMVEGNSKGQFLCQQTSLGRGLRPLVENILGHSMLQ